jgi:drug/metabolite transporter (DMT)-like permease
MTERARWKTLLAFAIIYIVWGSTFLAIRVGVREVPPLLLAAMCFLAAGAVLFGWGLARGEPSPSTHEWRSAFLLGFVIFGLDYGSVFWAEQRVPSGLTAVMLALIPAFTAISEIFVLRTQTLTLRLALALLIGLGGIAVLMRRSIGIGGEPINNAGALGLILAAAWSIASVLTRRVPLPASKVMSSGAQMLAGGFMLTAASSASGEFRDFHPAAVSTQAWVSLLYLIVFGSVIAFTAYLWLIHHESPTKVGTYAYVNPVVAVIVGYFFGGEDLGLRTVLGTMFVLVSVIVITITPTSSQHQSLLRTSPPLPSSTSPAVDPP